MTDTNPMRKRNPVRTAVRFLVKGVLPIAILAGSAVAAVNLMETAPKATRQAPERLARLVDITTVQSGTDAVIVEAMGTVRAARKINLQPRVGGQVSWISPEFVPGGFIAKGQPILRIDPTDFELVVKQKEAALAEAEANLKIEAGQQNIAKREYELLAGKVTTEERDLVLRQPQLATVQAAVDTAEAALRQAKLDLARATVTTPFDAIIGDRSADVGLQVTTSTTLTTLVGTETYWIEALVPVDKLQWIDIPRDNAAVGSVVRIHNDTAWGIGVTRTGHVLRLTSDLEEEGRMAKLLIAVDDPIALKAENDGKPRLLIGSYVRVEIEGARLSGPLIARDLLRDNDTIWIMNEGNALEIRPIDVIFRGPESVVVGDGVKVGERIVATDLTSPVDGMALRTRGAAKERAK